MNFELKNDLLCVTIAAHGAEVRSVRDKAGTEFMWQADPAVWPRTAPVLFPIIGLLPDNAYTMHGQRYTMFRHGFARDLPFSVTEQTDTAITLRLMSDAQTRAVYPFDFTLDITYTLDGATVHKTHTVTNRSPETMPFALGGHDGFRLALEPGETMNDYYLRFAGVTALQTRDIGLGRGTQALPLDEGRLWLSMALFHNDALVIDSPAAHQAQLCNARGTRCLTFDFPDFPLLGIWTPNQTDDTNFVCLEAWNATHSGALMGKGLATADKVDGLLPGTQVQMHFRTTFSPAEN